MVITRDNLLNEILHGQVQIVNFLNITPSIGRGIGLNLEIRVSAILLLIYCYTVVTMGMCHWVIMQLSQKVYAIQWKRGHLRSEIVFIIARSMKILNLSGWRTFDKQQGYQVSINIWLTETKDYRNSFSVWKMG